MCVCVSWAVNLADSNTQTRASVHASPLRYNFSPLDIYPRLPPRVLTVKKKKKKSKTHTKSSAIFGYCVMRAGQIYYKAGFALLPFSCRRLLWFHHFFYSFILSLLLLLLLAVPALLDVLGSPAIYIVALFYGRCNDRWWRMTLARSSLSRRTTVAKIKHSHTPIHNHLDIAYPFSHPPEWLGPITKRSRVFANAKKKEMQPVKI